MVEGKRKIGHGMRFRKRKEEEGLEKRNNNRGKGNMETGEGKHWKGGRREGKEIMEKRKSWRIKREMKRTKEKQNNK